MRVVQLIDTLEPGGAERMAVNIANGFSERVEFSGLVITRHEGVLSRTVNEKVGYLFLSKTKTIDIKALIVFIQYLRKNKVKIIHAHSSSYFFAVLTKILYPKVKLFWHDHHGNRVNSSKSNRIIKWCSLFFSGVFTVNEELKVWAENTLFCKNISFIFNFSSINQDEKQSTFLKGENDKRIVCLSNLRNPKNHGIILKAFLDSAVYKQGWTLHFIGKDSNDDYSETIKKFVNDNAFKNSVFLYDSCSDIQHILSQCEIGILASTFEGFPVTLLEYGMAKLAVITTNVGYCSKIIDDNKNGFVFSPLDSEELKMKILHLTENKNLIKNFGKQLVLKVSNDFSENAALSLLEKKYLES